MAHPNAPCPYCGKPTGQEPPWALCPVCAELIEPKIEWPGQLSIVSSAPDAPNKYMLEKVTIPCQGEITFTNNAALLGLLPYQAEMMDYLPAFKARIWRNNLQSGEAAG